MLDKSFLLVACHFLILRGRRGFLVWFVRQGEPISGLLVFFSCPFAHHSMVGVYANSSHAVNGPREACFWQNSRYSFKEQNRKDFLNCSISIPVTFLRLLFLHSTSIIYYSVYSSLFCLWLEYNFLDGRDFCVFSSLFWTLPKIVPVPGT